MPHEFGCAQWGKHSANFIRDPTQLTLELHTNRIYAVGILKIISERLQLLWTAFFNRNGIKKQPSYNGIRVILESELEFQLLNSQTCTQTRKLAVERHAELVEASLPHRSGVVW